MASPEALLLRHRVHTTNICKKVIRSQLSRLFKIGHLFVYFFVNFHTCTPAFAAVRPSEPASSKTGLLPLTVAEELLPGYGNSSEVSLAG